MMIPTASQTVCNAKFSSRVPRRLLPAKLWVMSPIVLHHGLFGTDEVRLGPLRRSYWHKIDSALRERGNLVISTRVHPTAGVETRARELKQQILSRLDGAGHRERIVIIAHSMGGLDARYMIAKLGMARHVRALVTVCTPHRGSPYADWIERNLGRRIGLLPVLRKLGLDLSAGIDLTTERCARFNEEVPDHPDVRYASVNCVRPRHQMPAFALHSHTVIGQAEGENDGLVSAKSAVWGEHLASWPIDHWQAINRRYVIRLPGGDVSPRYVALMEQLER